MFSCSRKLDIVKNESFVWCKEYKIANNVIWDDVVKNCLDKQRGVMEEGNGDELEFRKDQFDQALVKLAYWKQRAKGKWAMLGDNNTSFFYRYAKSRKLRNEIKLLQKDNGEWTSDSTYIKLLIVMMSGQRYQIAFVILQ